MTNELLITDIRNSKFSDLYSKLLSNDDITINEQNAILKLALIYINEEDQHVKNFGYRVLLAYANTYQNYEILYDIAINSGLIPISKYIEQNNNEFNTTNSFFYEFISSFMENYKDDNIYLTQEQKNLQMFFDEYMDQTVSIVAPTSYGKSSIILSTIKKNPYANICIVVPSKALLEQTKKRILDEKISTTKIIVHPEMYQKNSGVTIAVLTQERLLRLLKENKELFFDITFVDEAHNLLENNDRNLLLASAIAILHKRNTNTKFKFLTPFLIDSHNLKVAFTDYVLKEFRITEYIKSEKVYLYDFRKDKENTLKFYDHFLNKFFNLNQQYKDDIDLILHNKKNKNIIYFNRPIIIEKFTKRIINRLPVVKSTRIHRACDELKKHLHGDYNLIDALKHGVVYHHGSVPSYVRLYIEYLFKTEEELQFIITSSTLLEGVNIPAEVLFILDNKKGTGSLTPSQFKNLIGRVSRFSEVFSSNSGDMKLLEPAIFLIASDYFHKRWLLENYIEKTMKIDIKINDDPKNPLLEQVEINDNNAVERNDAEIFLENFEKNIIQSDKISYANTIIGKLCFENNVTEIDIIQNEYKMQSVVDNYLQRLIKIDDSNTLMFAICNIFIAYIKQDDRYKNIARLSNEKARTFYSMFFNWKIESTSYSQMIFTFLNYWKKIIETDKETLIYVDSKWGEEKREGFLPLWVDIKTKNIKERVNLAIVRIHDEQEFLDNVINKFVDILNELNILDEKFYNSIKYGTTDDHKIILIKNGISFSLAHLLIDHYKTYIKFEKNDFNISKDVLAIMQNNDENEILIFETNFNIHNK